MDHRIGQVLLVALSLIGLAACGEEKSPTPDIKSAAETPKDGAVENRSSARSDAAASNASTSTNEDSAGAPSTDATQPDATPASEASPTSNEIPPDPNAPTVRVYQVDETDSIEITVDARHMAKNLSFDDPRCNVTFVLGDDPGKKEEAKVFTLQSFLSRETPLLKVFRHRLGTGATAVSYAFAATQRVLGVTGAPRRTSIKTRKALVIKRPIGSMVARDDLKIARSPSRIITPQPAPDSLQAPASTVRKDIPKNAITPPSRVGNTAKSRHIRPEVLRPR